MKQSTPPRRTARLSRSVSSRLDRYALAGGATAVGMLALAPPAQGEIVFTPVHHTLKTHDIFHLDLNHDKTVDFLLSNHQFCTTDVCGRTLRALPAGHLNQVAGFKGQINTFYASALNQGDKIGPKLPFSGKLMAASGTEYGSIGKWFNVSDRYLGLKFVIHGKIHYGWARLSVKAGGQTISAVLTGYAYETIANKPIIAGKKKGSAAVRSQPATLAHMARGAAY